MGWATDHCYEIRTRDAASGIPNDILATAIRLGMPNKIFAEAMRSGSLYGWNNDLLDARRARVIDVIKRAGIKTLGPVDIHRSQIMAPTTNNMAANDTAVFS